jgi:16S rRNA processing protein RimM
MDRKAMDGKVCVGAITGAKGIRGEVRIKSFTAEPADIGAYGPVTTSDGRAFKLKVVGSAKDLVTARLEGIADRNAAEALKGMQLFVERSRLPPPGDGQVYHADLIGLAARLETGEALGNVTAVLNYGGGDILEVTRPDGDTELIPFGIGIAGVDLAAKVVTIAAVPGLFDDGSEPPPEEKAGGEGSR